MIRINPWRSELTSEYFRRYRSWKACQKLFNTKYADDVVELAEHVNDSDDYIICFEPYSFDSINDCPDSVVGIDMIKEGAHSYTAYENKLNNDKHYIIFTNCTYCDDYIDLNCTLIPYHFMLYDITYSFLGSSSFNGPNGYRFINKDYDFNYPKPYTFTSIIGDPYRFYRKKIVDQLVDQFRDSKFILKFNDTDYGADSSALDFTNGDYVQYIRDTITSDFDSQLQRASYRLIPTDIINAGNFYIVVETDYDQHESELNDDFWFLVTEKTLKSLLFGVPFVIFGAPYFYERVRDLGFKTYDTLWDESFDEIIDDNERMLRVVEVCKQLKDFDWEGHKQELMDIAMHNKLNFLNVPKIEEQQFIEFEEKIKKFK